MKKYLIITALLVSCSVTKKQHTNTAEKTDLNKIEVIEAVKASTLESTSNADSTGVSSADFIIDFDSSKAVIFPADKYQVLILNEDTVQSNLPIKQLKFKKRQDSKTSKQTNEKAKDTSALKSTTSTSDKKENSTTTSTKEKAYSLPWYFWILLIIGGMIITYLILKRFKIVS